MMPDSNRFNPAWLVSLLALAFAILAAAMMFDLINDGQWLAALPSSVARG